MEIGNDDLDFIDEEVGLKDTTPQDTGDFPEETPDPVVEEESDKEEPEEDFLTSLLKSRGIEDKSKIKFENEEGAEEEVDWESLSNGDKLSIINSTINNPETDLDDSEIQLINTIRSNNMTPSEYLLYIELNGVERYVQNSLQSESNYSTDQYTDDELFVLDFMARMGDVTDEEAQEALERAKSNETLFAKQIGAIRNEYKKQEDELNRQALIEQEQQAQEQYNQFADSVAELINNFTEFSGYELNLENDDMQQLYEFITGFDAAGNNHFAKALADPKTLVRTAYLALNGQQMVDDITSYFQKEIAQVRKESYEKGKAEALKKKDKSNVVFKKSTKSSNNFESELDDFE